MKVKIVGDGSFGSFLKVLFHPLLDEKADVVILAVPADAYEEVASAHKNKHLVNVCSRQHKTNQILQRHSMVVTGIHPLFGERTFGNDNRKCIVTHYTAHRSGDVIQLFQGLGCTFSYMGGEEHDKLMARTHKPVLTILEFIGQFLDRNEDIPEDLLVPSYKAMRTFYESFKMPEGTINSMQ